MPTELTIFFKAPKSLTPVVLGLDAFPGHLIVLKCTPGSFVSTVTGGGGGGGELISVRILSWGFIVDIIKSIFLSLYLSSIV